MTWAAIVLTTDPKTWTITSDNCPAELRAFYVQHDIADVNQITENHLRATLSQLRDQLIKRNIGNGGALKDEDKLELIFFCYCMKIHTKDIGQTTEGPLSRIRHAFTLLVAPVIGQYLARNLIGSPPPVNNLHDKYLTRKRDELFNDTARLKVIEAACLNDRFELDNIFQKMPTPGDLTYRRIVISHALKICQSAAEDDPAIKQSPAIKILESLIEQLPPSYTDLGMHSSYKAKPRVTFNDKLSVRFFLTEEKIPTQVKSTRSSCAMM